MQMDQDDIIGHMFQFMSQYELLATMCLVSHQWYNLVYHCMRTFKVSPDNVKFEKRWLLSLQRLLDADQLGRFPNLRCLMLNKMRQGVPHIMQMISESVPGLESLSITSCKFVKEIVIDETVQFYQLKSLNVTLCPINSFLLIDEKHAMTRTMTKLNVSHTNLDDDFCENVLPHFVHLNSLTMKSCLSLRSPHFKNPTITKLNLRQCNQIREFKNNMSELSGTLVHLNLSFCTGLNGRSVGRLLSTVGHSLHYLEMRMIIHLFAGPEEEEQDVEESRVVTERIFSCPIPLDKLRHLYVNWSKITDKDLTNMLHCCPNLITLELAYSEHLINPTIVHSQLECLYLDYCTNLRTAEIVCPNLHKLNIACTDIKKESLAQALLFPLKTNKLQKVAMNAFNILPTIQEMNEQSEDPTDPVLLETRFSKLAFTLRRVLRPGIS